MHKEFKMQPPPRGEISPRVTFLSKLIRSKFNKALSEEGVFSGQQDILLVVSRDEGHTIGELAKIIGATKATVSVSIKRLEKNGFVEKKQDENDARIYRIYPTKKTKEIPSRIRSKMQSFEDKITEGMSEEEKLQLSDLLQLAIDNIIKEENIDA